MEVSNTDRSFGTIFGSEITKKYDDTLEEDTFIVKCTGAGGQSFGAFIPKGLTLEPVSYTHLWNLYHNSVLRGTSLPWHRLPAFESVFGSEDSNCIIGSNIWSHAF